MKGRAVAVVAAWRRLAARWQPVWSWASPAACTLALGLLLDPAGWRVARAEPASVAVAAGPAASIEPAAPCRLSGLATEARCGTVWRPLHPDRPASVRLPIRFAVLPAVARVPLADPVVFLAGGPGQGAIELAGAVQALLGRLNNRRDILLVDLRGTGRSEALSCAFDGPDAARRPLAESFDAQRREAAVAACRRALQARGGAGGLGDLSAYGTTRAVEDLLAVLDAWGARRVNLVAASYGTRVALEMARQAPQRIRRSVLDGVAPPDLGLMRSGTEDLGAALGALLQDCERDVRCQAAFARLRSQWQALLAAPPREITLPHPLTGEPERLVLDRSALQALVRGPLYSPASRAGLPAALDAAAGGRFEPLVGLAAAAGGAAARSGLATGLHLSVVCSEDGPALPAPAAPPPQTDFSFGDPYASLCRDWPRFEPVAGFRTLAVAGSPVWLMSGGLDPVTPPRHGLRVAAALGAQAVHSTIPAAGHGVLGGACMRDAVARFIETVDDAAALSLASASGERCAAALPRPAFRLAPWPVAASGEGPR